MTELSQIIYSYCNAETSSGVFGIEVERHGRENKNDLQVIVKREAYRGYLKSLRWEFSKTFLDERHQT